MAGPAAAGNLYFRRRDGHGEQRVPSTVNLDGSRYTVLEESRGGHPAIPPDGKEIILQYREFVFAAGKLNSPDADALWQQEGWQAGYLKQWGVRVKQSKLKLTGSLDGNLSLTRDGMVVYERQRWDGDTDNDGDPGAGWEKVVR